MALQTSASEIVNYRGNAASAMGGDPAAAILAGDTDAGLINQGVDLVFLHSFQKNKELYDKKVKDQQDIQELLSSDQLVLNQVLDNDREKLRTEYIKPIRDMLLANPNIKSNPDKYLELQNKINDLKEAKQYAASRYVGIKNMDTDIAKEVDPEERQRIQQHRDKMYSQDIYGVVKPYQKSLDFDDNIFAQGQEYKDDPTTTVEGDFLRKKQHVYKKPEDFINEVNNKYLESPTRVVPDQMELYAKNAKAMPNDWKLQKITEWNKAIDLVNKDYTRTPGMQGYIAPIRYEEITDQSGNRDIVIPETSPRLVLAESLSRNYYNKLHDIKDLSEIPSKIGKTKSETTENQAQAELARARARVEIPADAVLKRATADKYKTEIKKTNWEIDKDKAGGSFYTNTMLNMFNPDRYNNDKIYTMKDGTKLLSYDSFGSDNESALSDIEMNSLSKTYTIAGKTTKIAPKRVWYNNTDPENPFIETEYEIKTPSTNGKPSTTTMERKVWTPNTVLQGIVENSLTAGQTREAELSKAQVDWEKRTGGKKSISNNVSSTLEADDMKANASKRKAAADAFK